jgi:hypothetical protein
VRKICAEVCINRLFGGLFVQQKRKQKSEEEAGAERSSGEKRATKGLGT